MKNYRFVLVLGLVWISCESKKTTAEIPLEELSIGSIHQAFSEGTYTAAELV